MGGHCLLVDEVELADPLVISSRANEDGRGERRKRKSQLRSDQLDILAGGKNQRRQKISLQSGRNNC